MLTPARGRCGVRCQPQHEPPAARGGRPAQLRPRRGPRLPDPRRRPSGGRVPAERSRAAGHASDRSEPGRSGLSGRSSWARRTSPDSVPHSNAPARNTPWPSRKPSTGGSSRRPRGRAPTEAAGGPCRAHRGPSAGADARARPGGDPAVRTRPGPPRTRTRRHCYAGAGGRGGGRAAPAVAARLSTRRRAERPGRDGRARLLPTGRVRSGGRGRAVGGGRGRRLPPERPGRGPPGRARWWWSGSGRRPGRRGGRSRVCRAGWSGR